MVAALVILVVSAALIAGAALGIYGNLPEEVEGFIVALAGGALMVSAVLELIEPSSRQVSIWLACCLVLAGACAFAVLDELIKNRWGSDSGGGLLAAITLDGIPENLALGVALIGTGPLGAAALSGSILLSNLPEAAGGARGMARHRSNRSVLLLWTATAGLLSAAALAGNLLLTNAPQSALALIRCFAGGAVVGSLAIEVFPKAFKEAGFATGLAVSLGLVLALYLSHLG